MLLDRLTSALRVSVDHLEQLQRSANTHYAMITIVRPDGRVKVAHAPSRELKAVQRVLARTINSRFQIHNAAHAYVLGRGIKSNAIAHIDSRYLLRMDFAAFFPSITRAQVISFLSSGRARLAEHWTAAERNAYADFVTRNGRLPMGAVTSPSISNAILYDADVEFEKLAQAARCAYTRYSDDLYFSTLERGTLGRLQRSVEKFVASDAFTLDSLSLNARKTRHFSKAGLRKVTGVVISSQGRLSLGRELKRQISARVHQLAILDERARSSLAGLLAHARSVEPEFINRLTIKYGASRMADAQKIVHARVLAAFAT